MKDSTITIPVGTRVLGRVLNARSEPIDKQEPLSSETPRVPLYMPASAGAARAVPGHMFETGIKVIDLLAPIPRGGIVGMLSEPGLGKLVVMEEIMHNLLSSHHGYVVCVGTGEHTYEASELWDMIRDVEAEGKVVMLFEEAGDDVKMRRQLLRAGLTIAAHFHEQGQEVLFIVGKQVITRDNVADLHELKQAVQAISMPTLLFEPPDETVRPRQDSTFGELDAQIVFSRELPKQELWPAIDRLASGSRLLEGDTLGEEHQKVARQVRQLLQNTGVLRADENITGLSQEELLLLKRAQRVHQFLTQPFFVAETYTDIPGEYVKVEDTMRGFKVLLEGRYDDLPAKAFWFVGTLEQAIAKAQQL